MSIDIGTERPTLIDIRVIGPVLARCPCAARVYIYIYIYRVRPKDGDKLREMIPEIKPRTKVLCHFLEYRVV